MPGLASEERLHKLLARHAQMVRDIGQNARQGSEPQWVVQRNGDVVLIGASRGEPQVTARLPHGRVADTAQQFGQPLS